MDRNRTLVSDLLWQINQVISGTINIQRISLWIHKKSLLKHIRISASMDVHSLKSEKSNKFYLLYQYAPKFIINNLSLISHENCFPCNCYLYVMSCLIIVHLISLWDSIFFWWIKICWQLIQHPRGKYNVGK